MDFFQKENLVRALDVLNRSSRFATISNHTTLGGAWFYIRNSKTTKSVSVIFGKLI